VSLTTTPQLFSLSLSLFKAQDEAWFLGLLWDPNGIKLLPDYTASNLNNSAPGKPEQTVFEIDYEGH
jgi:hypothetical protein